MRLQKYTFFFNYAISLQKEDEKYLKISCFICVYAKKVVPLRADYVSFE